jgi:hypothetical protein
MNKQQAIEFLQILNAMQPFVPPTLFTNAARSDAVQIMSSLAAGNSTGVKHAGNESDDA